MPSTVSKFSPPPPQQWPDPQPAPPYSPGPTAPFYPLTIGRTVSLAFNLFRFGWRTFAAISVVAVIPIVLVNAFVTSITFQQMSDWQRSLLNDVTTRPSATTADVIASFPWPALALTFAVALLLGPISYLSNAAVVSATWAAVSGERLSFTAAYRAAFNRIASLLALYVVVTALSIFLSALSLFGPLLAFAVPGALGGGGPVAFGFLIVGVAAVFLSIFVLIRLFFALQVLMIENASVGTAIRRSYNLVAGSMWRVVGYALVFGVVLALIGLAVGIVAFFVGALIEPQTLTSPAAAFDMRLVIAQDITAGILSAIFLPISMIGMVLLYLDLRWRHGESVPVPGQVARS